MQTEDAIEDHPDGVIIRFDVVPGASRVKVPSGFNPWRRSLEAKLTEKPTRGKANKQLISEVSSLLEVSRDCVQVISGQKSSRKVVLVRGIDVEKAVLHLLPLVKKK
jgi:uncharacterized protein (TIGR00251 family)